MTQSTPPSAPEDRANSANRQVPGAFDDSTYATANATATATPTASHLGAGQALTEDALQNALQDAALAVPDTDALSVSSLHTTSTDRAADEQAAFEDSTDISVDDLQSTGSYEYVAPTSTEEGATDTSHELDLSHLLGLSGQGLSAVNTATSAGFAAARTTTSFSLAIAKRITQSLVALPAMALDGTLMGNAPSTRNYDDASDLSGTQSIAQVAHKAVGGLFDVISTLAIGGIDLGTAVTGASLGAAVSGVEGVRRALGSEVLRSLGAFSRLVRREWNSASDDLPPGGIPGYSILGITQAMTAWVCIQMVTREYYEKRMLQNLDAVDLHEVHAEIAKAAREEEEEHARQEQDGDQTFATAVQDDASTVKSDAGTIDSATTTPKRKKKAKKQVRILDDKVLPGDEGDVIDAEIGSAGDALSENVASKSVAEPQDHVMTPSEASATPTPAPTPLTNAEAVAGLKRYSRLVLGVYGGVALAWLGSLPPDLMEAAGSVVDGRQQNANTAETELPRPSEANDESQSILVGRPRGRSAAQDDADDFLRAASSLDLDEADLIEDEAESLADLNPDAMSSTSPKRSGTSTPRASAGQIPSSSEVLFSADGVEPTPSRPSEPQAARNWSYYDILMGTADGDLFHRLGGLQHGTATEGDYNETASQAGSAAQRLRRVQNRVARPSKPRYYVVTDHTQRKVVLVLRGSLTLGDIAIDLTCESANFDVHDGHSAGDGVGAEDEETDTGSEGPAPAEDFSEEAMRERAQRRAASAAERRREPQSRAYERSAYIVHEGMYETAKEIGEPGRPVHRAVRRAMLAHPGYSLDITGHSLGAGVAALLALMWASPETGLTVKKSGLPVGRRTHAYCFAVPCVMGEELGKRASTLVTSYCYSYDLVCRLSLGAILDIRNACAWLAYENAQPADAGANGAAGNASRTEYGLARPLRLINIMQRAFLHQSGRLSAQDKVDLEADMLALRKTLEANMTAVELYPPGTVLYSLASTDVEAHLLSPEAQRQIETRLRSDATLSSNASCALAQRAVLFRLRDDASRGEVFGQIINGRGMLSRHMPHIYHAAIDAL